MTCFKRGDVVRIPRANRKAVVVGHDGESPRELIVVFPHTRHEARVRKEWLKRERP